MDMDDVIAFTPDHSDGSDASSDSDDGLHPHAVHDSSTMNEQEVNEQVVDKVKKYTLSPMQYWTSSKNIIDCILGTHESTMVFGGAIETIIRHDDAANKFYKIMSDRDSLRSHVQAHLGVKMQDDDFPDDISLYVRELYAHKECLPDLADRRLAIHDIDCYIQKGFLPLLVDRLKKENFDVMRVFNHDAKEYLKNIKVKRGSVSHMMYLINPMKRVHYETIMAQYTTVPPTLNQEVRDLVSKMATVQQSIRRIRVDVLVCNTGFLEPKVLPPFGGLDFHVNGLHLLGNGALALCPELREDIRTSNIMDNRDAMGVVIDDILNHRAVMINPKRLVECPWRASKVLGKGYRITGFSSFEYVENTTGDESVCSICLGDLNGLSRYKMQCCNTWMHLKCLQDTIAKGPSSMLRTKACFVCKQHLYNIAADAVVIDQIVSHVTK
jgi:hypothetical protein